MPKFVTLLMLGLLSGSVFAIDLPTLQSRWAEANYAANGDAKEKALEQLVKETESLGPQDLSLLTWKGIINSSYAGAKGGLGALKYAKEAKAAFEAVIAKDASTLNGSALTSLGVLYHKVPGWPIAFGDDKKAADLLKRGLAANPDGIDSNYFYAEFLADQGDKAAARQLLLKARQAAPRPGRESADRGRQGEITALLNKLGS
ncbi:tetratricopeptide repeat protein [Chitinimonas sp. BJYL2]|uniref:tetratricopeptide repeat protein n=1 Tax=Chitinimonas sp. BJYL2 TaxID=2976696 RepID=UPI0022B4CDBD|nr:tetratricopeptide repeat protein [Chitinimonas sp. BJYL2]